MSPGLVFDHPGLCPPGTVATGHDHVRRKHFAAEFVYFVVMIHDDNDRYKGPAAERGMRTTFIAGYYRKSWVNIDVSHAHIVTRLEALNFCLSTVSCLNKWIKIDLLSFI
jgi:hypothetical protein